MLQSFEPSWWKSTATEFTAQQSSGYRAISVSIPTLQDEKQNQTRTNCSSLENWYASTSTGFLAKWRLRNEHRNSILMMRHYQDLGRASDWSCREGNLPQPIGRSTTEIRVVLISQTSLRGETSGSVVSHASF